MANIPNELTYLVQNPSGVSLRWEDGSVMQGFVLPANMTFRGVLHPHDLVEVTSPPGFPGYVNVYEVAEIGGPVPSVHVGDGASGGWGPVIDEPQYCVPGTWWDPTRAMCVPLIPPPPPPQPAPSSLRTSGVFGSRGLAAVIASMFNPAGSVIASAMPGGGSGEARVGWHGHHMHPYFQQPWQQQSWHPWHHHHHHHHPQAMPPQMEEGDDDDDGGYMTGWKGWEGGEGYGEGYGEPWHRHHHHHHRPWWENYSRPWWENYGYYTGAEEEMPHEHGVHPAHPDASPAPTMPTVPTVPAVPAHPGAPPAPTVQPVHGASVPAHPTQPQPLPSTVFPHYVVQPTHPAHEATHEARRAGNAARVAQHAARHPAAREAARSSAAHATHAERHARAAQRARTTREARHHADQARRHTRMAERHAERAHGYGRTYAQRQRGYGRAYAQQFPATFEWGEQQQPWEGGWGWGGEGDERPWRGWHHRREGGAGFYGQGDVRPHFRRHRAECIQRDSDDGVCLKERIFTPSGRIVFRLTPAGIERMAALEEVEQMANDAYAQVEGQPAPGPDMGPMPGSEDSGGPSPDSGMPSPDTSAPGGATPDMGALDQGAFVPGPGPGAPDLGGGASPPAEGGATATQGYFAGWDMAFTDPYGRIDPNLPPAWDSEYLYMPAAFAVGIQSGPAIVGIQSGPAIVGVEGDEY